MTNEDILKALGNVQEPDLGKDIVTLNMVKDITIEGNYVSFTVMLTAGIPTRLSAVITIPYSWTTESRTVSNCAFAVAGIMKAIPI